MNSLDETVSEAGRLYSLGRFRESVDAYSLAASMGCGAEVFFNRSLAYIQVKEYDNALSDIDRYCLLAGDDCQGHYLRGLVLDYKGDYQSALNEYLRALSADQYMIKAVRQTVSLTLAVKKTPDKQESIPEHGVMIDARGELIRLRELTCQDNILSQTLEDSIFSGGFWDFCLAPAMIKDDIRQVLLIGVAAGTIARQYVHFTGCAVDAVDPSIEIMSVCEKYFGKMPDEVVGHKMCGVEYMLGCDKKYDVIVFDAFVGEHVADELKSPAALRTSKKILSDDGFLVWNTLVDGGVAEVEFVKNLLCDAFANVYSACLDTNRVFIASDNLPNEKLTMSLSDPTDERLTELGKYILPRVKLEK